MNSIEHMFVDDDPIVPIVEDVQEEIIEEEFNTPDIDEDASNYFEYLKVNNVLDIPEDFVFDGTPDKIQEALDITKSNLVGKVAESMWNQLPQDFKPLLEYALQGGTSLQDYLNAYTPVEYSEQDLDDPISQKAIIRDYYKAINPNYKDDKIDRMIGTLEKMEDTSLKDEAVEAIEYLKELRKTQQNQLIESAKMEKIKAEERAAERAQKITELIDKTDQDSLRKNRIKSILFHPIKKGTETTTEFNYALNSILSTPEHLVQFAEIVADYDPRVGFNFGRLTKQLETKSTKKFKDLMQSKLDTKTAIKGNPNKPKDDFDLAK